MSGRESLLPRVSSLSVVSPNVSHLRPRNGGNSYKSTPHACCVSTIFPTMYVETHEKFEKPTQTPRNIAWELFFPSEKPTRQHYFPSNTPQVSCVRTHKSHARERNYTTYDQKTIQTHGPGHIFPHYSREKYRQYLRNTFSEHKKYALDNMPRTIKQRAIHKRPRRHTAPEPPPYFYVGFYVSEYCFKPAKSGPGIPSTTGPPPHPAEVAHAQDPAPPRHPHREKPSQ